MDGEVEDHQFTLAMPPGSGVFVESGQALGSFSSFDVSLGDVDADGDLDAVVANLFQGNRVWRNDGSGNFTDSGPELGGPYKQCRVSGAT